LKICWHNHFQVDFQWNNTSSTNVFNQNAKGGLNENKTKVDPDIDIDVDVDADIAGAGVLLKFKRRLPDPNLRDKTADER